MASEALGVTLMLFTYPPFADTYLFIELEVVFLLLFSCFSPEALLAFIWMEGGRLRVLIFVSCRCFWDGGVIIRNYIIYLHCTSHAIL